MLNGVGATGLHERKNYKVVQGTTVNLNVLEIPRASHSVLFS